MFWVFFYYLNLFLTKRLSCIDKGSDEGESTIFMTNNEHSLLLISGMSKISKFNSFINKVSILLDFFYVFLVFVNVLNAFTMNGLHNHLVEAYSISL